jgi:hypothetical protein
MDYATCKASLDSTRLAARRPPRRSLTRDLFWLHFPKCGTSFGSALVGIVCQSTPSAYVHPTAPGQKCTYCGRGPGKTPVHHWDYEIKKLIPFEELPYCNWNVSGAHSYTNHLLANFDRYQDRVGLFRDPRKRLVSSWNDNKHSFGLWPADREGFYAATDTIDKYVASPAIKGCMAKMLLGAPCAAHKRFTAADVAEARRRVHRMAFAGLTDAFNASVCLFFHMFEGEMMEWMFSTHARNVDTSTFALKDAALIHGSPEDMAFNGLRGPGHRVSKAHWCGRDFFSSP